ncbi:hypothetical protein BLOT_000199 [Blomia tropicalis]|nr:hypothetical protein BLOT_000199 [Blomia tropicalis]
MDQWLKLLDKCSIIYEELEWHHFIEDTNGSIATDVVVVAVVIGSHLTKDYTTLFINCLCLLLLLLVGLYMSNKIHKRCKD